MKAPRSQVTIAGTDRASHRAFYRAMGLSVDDLTKPLIGIVSFDGDRIVIDCVAMRMDLLVNASELDRRRQAWVPPPAKHRAGVLAKYARLVGQAPGGAVTHQGPAHWPV